MLLWHDETKWARHGMCACMCTCGYNRARETVRHKQTHMKRDNEKNKSAGDCGSRNLTWPPQKVKKTSSEISLRENTVCQTEAVLWALVFLGVCLVGWGLCQLLLRCSFPSDSLQQHTHGCWTVLQLMKLNSTALKWKCMVRLHCQMCIRCLKVTISSCLWNAYFIIHFHFHHFQVHSEDSLSQKMIQKLVFCVLLFGVVKKRPWSLLHLRSSSRCCFHMPRIFYFVLFTTETWELTLNLQRMLTKSKR